jgi:hypothetical protein
MARGGKLCTEEIQNWRKMCRKLTFVTFPECDIFKTRSQEALCATDFWLLRGLWPPLPLLQTEGAQCATPFWIFQNFSGFFGILIFFSMIKWSEEKVLENEVCLKSPDIKIASDLIVFDTCIPD